MNSFQDRLRVPRSALLVAACLLVGLTAFALGWQRAGHDVKVPPPEQVASAATRSSQRAPASAASTVAHSASSAADETIVPWPLWEFQLAQPLPERDPPRTPLPWRMIGAGQSGGKWQLIVLRQGKTDPEYFGVGDQLPGGYRVVAISDEDVTLKQGRKTLILSYIGTQ